MGILIFFVLVQASAFLESTLESGAGDLTSGLDAFLALWVPSGRSLPLLRPQFCTNR